MLLVFYLLNARWSCCAVVDVGVDGVAVVVFAAVFSRSVVVAIVPENTLLFDLLCERATVGELYDTGHGQEHSDERTSSGADSLLPTVSAGAGTSSDISYAQAQACHPIVVCSQSWGARVGILTVGRGDPRFFKLSRDARRDDSDIRGVSDYGAAEVRVRPGGVERVVGQRFEGEAPGLWHPGASRGHGAHLQVHFSL